MRLGIHRTSNDVPPFQVGVSALASFAVYLLIARWLGPPPRTRPGGEPQGDGPPDMAVSGSRFIAFAINLFGHWVPRSISVTATVIVQSAASRDIVGDPRTERPGSILREPAWT